MAHALYGCETHNGKGENNERGTGEQCSEAAATQITHPKEKSCRKSFPATDFAGCLMSGPILEQNHFIFKSEKNDQRNHNGKAYDKKGEDDHHGAVSQLKGRMNHINHGDEQDQDDAEGNDPFVNISIGKKITFQAKRERDKQRNIEEDAKENIFLGFFHTVIYPQGQGP